MLIMTNFSVGQMTMYSATPTRRLYSLYQVNQELDKEEIGKPYSKIDLFLCNVSNVDDAVDRKVVEDKRVNMKRSCIETSPIFKPSNIVADHQKQNANNDEDEFANISPSLLFPSAPLQNTENIQLSSISLQSTDNIQGFLQPPSGYQEEAFCGRDFLSPSNGRNVFCPICNNASSINTIEEHADLCHEKLSFSLKNTLKVVTRESY